MLSAHGLNVMQTTYREALQSAVRCVHEAEHCDSTGEFDDRDVRLTFAQVWAQIATAARPPESGTTKE